MSDDLFLNGGFRDPSKETNIRVQDDKETLGDVANNSPPPWSEGERLNDFVLEKLLGSGSSGFVYRALDVRTNRRCALKLLKNGSPDDLLRNKLGFRRMMSLQHPNLLRVDRIYQLGSYIALSMEEVDGVTFGEAVRQYQKLDPNVAYEKLLGLMRDFAAGLAMMHSCEFLHRDIKPENLMVDSQGRGRVIDYGLVDSFGLDDSPGGSSNFLVGTPHYFSPEVICNQVYLPAGDIFSLGIVMLDALGALRKSSGQKQTGLARSRKNQNHDAERIDKAVQELSALVPSTILSACREMLDRHASERPTATQLARLGLEGAVPVLWPNEEPIVGRDHEQQEIFDWIDGIFDGEIGRLHLTGPSGIGKTRLLAAIVAYIEEKPWGQVFLAKCRLREDQPLQAFDQICDAIANRYMQDDRERLQIDPVSAELLLSIFPVLKNVIECSMQIAPAGTTTDRLDSLEAAARLSEQLRVIGPLFLVIDDSQWADRDSLNVLDRLQTAVGSNGLGIITVSRKQEDPQRVLATKQIDLQPLTLEDSICILQRAASRWSVEVDAQMLRDMAQSTQGSPFRLRQLSDEFRPGGAIWERAKTTGTQVKEFFSIDRLWHERAERLSDDAKRVLTYVVTAGGAVSTQHLGELTGLADSVDAAVSELAHQRWITDEATGGDCIKVFHDRVADDLIHRFSEEDKRKAHHAWASLLVREDNPESLAARIAGHFFAAGEPGRAVSHAILAAEDAERLVAMTEAARWYSRVIDHVEGPEKISQMRNAARCYCEADYPVMAADYYQKLAALVDAEERIECQLVATTLLLRSGHFPKVRDQLRELAHSLRLPKPKPPTLGLAMVLGKSLRHRIFAKNPLLAENVPTKSFPVSEPKTTAKVQRKEADKTRIGQLRLRLCLSLVRPMSMFDNLYAAELNLTSCRLAVKYGTPIQRVHVAVGEAVFGCYDRGQSRINAQAALVRMQPHVARLKSDRASGDLWAGIANAHALSCRWDQVSQPVNTSIEHYRQITDANGFEITHTRWLEFWANWNLGRWSSMTEVADVMLEEAVRRNDLLQFVTTSGGFSRGAWLACDRVGEVNRIRNRSFEFEFSSEQTQLFDVFEWIGNSQELVYEGKFAEAWNLYQGMEVEIRKMPFRRIQMIRVARQSIGALIALHRMAADASEQWSSTIRLLTHELRREQIHYCQVLANLYDGLLYHQIARLRRSEDAIQQSRQYLEAARDLAGEECLRPYQFAAEDALAEIHTGESLQMLVGRMKQQQVKRPDLLSRLYTLPFGRGASP